VGALPVLENDEVVGIVTITCLLKFLASNDSLTEIELID
jgi:CBS domain-containing protein